MMTPPIPKTRQKFYITPMQFGPFPVGAAQGAILAHSVRPLSFRKGRVLSADDVAQLEAAGIREIMAAKLEPGDVAEDEAARRIANAAAGGGVRIGAPFTGRANLYAERPGLVVIDAAAIDDANRTHEAITIATLAPFAKVTPGQMLATVKIIPFAAPETAMAKVEQRLRPSPVIQVAPFQPRRAALISTRLAGMKPQLLTKNRDALEARLHPLGSSVIFERRTPHETEAVAQAIGDAWAQGADPIFLFGASAISDPADVLPRALQQAGGDVTALGMPVDPGNLLMMGTLQGRIVVGLPGCARSPKRNGFDFVLWRILAGLVVGREEIAAMGVGGLLAETERPQPREQAPRLPRIGAVVLAAGQSSRMGLGGQARNKLLQPLTGRPMIRQVVETALASAVSEVVVVTGNDKEKVVAALEKLPVTFVDNRDFSKGLSTSLISGLNALPSQCDGALVLLGDMPAIRVELLDRLIAAFAPGEDRAIVVASHGGKRGNPVLWAHRFFDEMRALSGDVGARALLGAHPELVCEVEAGSDAPLTDIDTEEALAHYRAHAEAE